MSFLWILSSRSDGLVNLPWHLDKAGHFILYMPLGFLLSRCLGEKRWPAALLAALACGIVDEYHQSFVPGRDTSAGDAVADLLGAAAGIAVAREGKDGGVSVKG